VGWDGSLEEDVENERVSLALRSGGRKVGVLSLVLSIRSPRGDDGFFFVMILTLTTMILTIISYASMISMTFNSLVLKHS